jgi:serine/threonine protein phosphatase 1
VLPLHAHIEGPITVIGDVHGQAGKLSILLARLRKRQDFGSRWIVFLGDFVDRGESVKTTLDTVLALRAEHARTTAVMGNHDLALAGAVGLIPVPTASNWPQRYIEHYDSDSTFRSYGVPVGDLVALAAAMPDEHKQFLAGLPWRVEHRENLIVHAGLLPDVPYADQLTTLRQRDFTLNRPPWLSERSLAHGGVPTDCKTTVVSGHVPVTRVTFGDRRVLVDTTGGKGGDLSAVLLPERLVITSAAKESAAWSRLSEIRRHRGKRGAE